MQRTYDEVLNMLNIATLDFMEAVVSQINVDNVVQARLMNKSKAAKGKKIDVPLLIAQEKVAAMGRYDMYDLAPVEILDEAMYDWRRINGTIVLDDMTVDVQNIEDLALINLAKTKTQNLSETMRAKFSTLLFTAAGSLTPKEPDSLIKIVATANNTVGGINAATSIGGNGAISLPYSWNPKVTDDSDKAITYANLVDPDSEYYVMKILRKQFAKQTIGSDKPTMILATQGFFDTYEEVLSANRMYDGKVMEVDGGFTGLSYRNVPMIVDNNVPGGKLNPVATNKAQVLFLNEDYLGYRHAPAMNFKWTPWKKLEQQPVYASMLDWAGAFICSRRDRQGAYIGIPTDADLGLT